MHDIRRNVALLLGSALVLVGCDFQFEGQRPSLRFGLNSNILANEDSGVYAAELAQDPNAQAQIRGALEMLFGTPDAPSFARPEEWIDDEYDPNYAGYYEISDAAFEAIMAQNEQLFAPELEAIARGNFADVRVQREALDLRDYWSGIMAEYEELQAGLESGDSTESELAEFVAAIQEEAPAAFIEWYPSLRESAELYRQQCLHCHGVEGGGDGTTAPFLNPRPRDYRPGIFKFTSLDNKSRPRREDLYRVLTDGIYPTAMPSFRRFSNAQLNGLVDYVRLLSIRGETEILLAVEFADNVDEGLPMELIQSTYLDVWEKWDAAADEYIFFDGEVPESTPEAIAHGRELYMDAKSANCVSCHGENGRGDGPSAFEMDADGNEVRVKDDWGNEIAPRDLNRGLFRFGRRPIDIYRRIYAGINGTPMPSHASMKDSEGERLLSDQDLWDIVHYVRSVSVKEASEG